MWRLINRKLKLKLGRTCKTKSCALPLIVNYSKQEEMYFLSPTGDCYNFSGSSLHLELPGSSNRLFVYNNPSELPLSSIKEHLSSLFSGLACDLPFRLHVLNKNALLFPNNPILQEKYLAICLLKVTNIIITKSPKKKVLYLIHIFHRVCMSVYHCNNLSGEQ